jgi:hypothetical protein
MVLWDTMTILLEFCYGYRLLESLYKGSICNLGMEAMDGAWMLRS